MKNAVKHFSDVRCAARVLGFVSCLAWFGLNSGCARKAEVAPVPVPTPPATAESQQNLSKFIQNDPNMPAAEKAAMQKHVGQGVK